MKSDRFQYVLSSVRRKRLTGSSRSFYRKHMFAIEKLEDRLCLNAAPVLLGANSFDSILQGAATTGGDTVAELIDGRITDEDAGAVKGIAIVGAGQANGSWQYSTDNGQSWSGVGTVSVSNALLLDDAPESKIRFVPLPGFSGTARDFQFRAWDRTSGTVGNRIDTSINGGQTAFSVATAIGVLTVHAQDSTVLWTGSADGVSWNQPGNWSSNTVPIATDRVSIGGSGNEIVIAGGAARSIYSARPIVVSGTLDVDGQFLVEANLRLNSANLRDASVAASSFGNLTVSGGGTWDSVSLNRNFLLASNQGLSIRNGLTLNGTLTLGDPLVPSQYGYMIFDGAQSLQGSGTVVFGNTNSNNSLLQSTAGAALTFGSGITVRGLNGALGFNSSVGGSSSSTVINLGRLEWTAGTDIRVPTLLVNAGLITVDSNGLFRPGLVQGGLITSVAGARFAASTLDGVTVSGAFAVVGNNGIGIRNGLTLNGTLTLGDPSVPSQYGYMVFDGAQSLQGSGTVVFGNTNSNNSLLQSTSGAALTLGSGITVRGLNGALGYNASVGGSSSSTVINLGRLEWTAGTDIRVPTLLVNAGLITVDSNGLFRPGLVQGGLITSVAGARFAGVTLDGVTVSGAFAVVGNNGIGIRNGLTLNGTLTLGDPSVPSQYGYMVFDGAQSLQGSGTVVFGNTNSNNSLLQSTSGAALTLGSGITVRGQSGTLGYNPNIGGSSTSVLVNNGTIQADVSGGTIEIRGGALDNVGTLKALSQGNLSVNLISSGSKSTGVIDAALGSTIVLNASFANTNTTISLSGAGSLVLGGTVVGGTVSIAAGAVARLNGTLEGVTLSGAANIVANQGTTVRNGLTLNGTLTLGDPSVPSQYGYMIFDGAQSLQGSGTVVFGNTNSNNSLLQSTAGAALTFGSGITVRGLNGALGFNSSVGGSSSSTVINLGRLEWTAGTDIRVPTLLVNAGLITVDSNGLFRPGLVQGGLITSVAGARFAASTLDGVTVSGAFAVVGNNGIGIRNGLTLNGTLTLGDPSVPSQYGYMIFDGAQSLQGSGTVVFGNTNSNNSLLQSTSGAALTLGSGITVRGLNGALGYNASVGGSSSSTVINLGRLEWTAGTDIRVPTLLVNAGLITVDSNGLFRPGLVQGGLITSVAGARFAASTLDGVTVSGAFAVVGNNGIGIRNDLTLNGTLTLGSGGNYGYLYLPGTQSIVGSGTIIFGNFNPGNSLLVNESGASLTIGSGVTIRGAVGTIGANTQTFGGSTNVTVINNGTILSDVASGTLNLFGNFVNNNAIRASGGGTLVSQGSLTNATTVNVDGTSFFSMNGNFIGGTVAVVAGGRVFGSTFRGVTFTGDLLLGSNQGMGIGDGLTLNGTLTLGSGGNYGYLYLPGTQSIVGSGTIIFGNFNPGNSLLVNESGASLTIGSGVTIRGAVGTIGANTQTFGGSTNVTVINNGTILSDVASGTLNLFGNFVNNNAIRASGGGTLVSQGSLTNATTVNVDGTSFFSMNGNFIGGTVAVVAGGRVFGSTFRGVTFTGDLLLGSNQGMGIGDGLTLNGTLTLGSGGNYGYLYLPGTQSIVGSGTIIFGNANSGNSLLVNEPGASLTIGSGITIRGVVGTIGANTQTFGGSTNVTVINNGTILSDVASGTLNLFGNFVNNNAIRASGGGTLVSQGSLTNATTVNVDGTSFFSMNGNFIGGTVAVVAGGRVFGSTFRGITFTGDLLLGSNQGMGIGDGLTLNGTLTLGSGGNYGYLYLPGTQSIVGSGTIIFGNANSGNSLLVNESGAQLTIGPGITVRGHTGTIGANMQTFGGSPNVRLVNHGKIDTDTLGGAVTLNVQGGALLNTGEIRGALGAISIFAPGLQNNGTVSVGPAGTVSLSGAYSQSETARFKTRIGGTGNNQFGRMTTGGAAALEGLLEVEMTGGFVPSSGESFSVIQSSSRTGQFTNYAGLTLSATIALQPAYSTTGVQLTTVSDTTVAPDLRVGSASITPSQPQSGQPVTVQWTVANAGNGAASSSWTDRVTIINTATGQTLATTDVLYNTATRGNLASGASANQTAVIFLPDGVAGTGALQALITVDATNVISEYYPGNVGETNNTRSVSFTATLANYPDLQISGLGFVGGILQTGQNATLSWRVANTGTGATQGNWADRITVVNTTTGQTIATGQVPYDASANGALAGGATSDARFFSFVLPDGAAGVGQLQATVVTDANGQLFEVNPSDTGEANNSSVTTGQATLGPYPELSVTSVSVPATAVFGSALLVNWTVLNSGNAILTRAISDRIYLSQDAQFDGTDRLLATVSAGSNVPLNIGASYNGSASVLLPLDVALAPGNYRLIVVTDNFNQQFELNESNNTQASNVTAIALPPLADLVVTSIDTASEVIAGQSVTVSWTVTNQGTGVASGPWQDQLLASSDATIGSDVLLGTFAFNGQLQPGASITRSQTITFGSNLIGTVRVVARTDSGGAVVEFTNDNNNESIDDRAIQVIATATPNLIVETINSPSTAFSGQPISVSWVVKNIGTGSTNALGWTDRVYLSSDAILDGNDLLLGSVSNASYLNAAESYQSSLTSTLPQGIEGNYRIIVVTDAGNAVSEPDAEADNSRVSAVVPVTLTPPPDLFVTVITAAPSQVFAGQQMQIGWTVVNQGTGPSLATSWADQLFVSFNGNQLDAGDTLLATVPHAGALEANGSYTVSPFNVTLPFGLSGQAHLLVRTDAGNRVFEHVFENNNVSSRLQNITALPPADLRVTSVTTAASVAAGQPLSVSYSVVNQGAGPTLTSSWADTIYLSPTPTLNTSTAIPLGMRSRSGILEAGQSESRTYLLSVPNNVVGAYYVIVDADSAGQVEEFDNGNNVGNTNSTVQVTLTPPDLVISALTLPSPVLGGAGNVVSYTVTNQGNSPTPVGQWSDAFYLSADSTLDAADQQLLVVERTGVLAVGQSRTSSVVVQLPANLLGSYYLIAVTDFGNAVIEQVETNNRSSQSFTIAGSLPDLAVRSFQPLVGTEPILVGTALSLNYSVENRGPGNVDAASWFDRLILSSDGQLGNADDVVLGSYPGVSSLNVNAIYTRTGRVFAIPLATAAGNYQLFLQTDSSQSVSEQAEGNNVSASVPITITTTPSSGFELADLQVSALSGPAVVTSGDSFPVSWTITNSGTGRTSATSWTDNVWLSTDSVIDSSDIRLGSFTRSAPLNAGQAYARSESVAVTNDLSGTFFLIVETDAGNQVFEGTQETNNVRASTTSTQILLRPSADLRVVEVTPPPQVNSGRPMLLSWIVKNDGAGSAVANWTDSVYLSLDQVFDPATDIPLGNAARPNNLSAGEQYSATASFDVPVALGGRYYVFVSADSNNRVVERGGEGNNLNYAAQSIDIVHLPPADLIVGDITIPTNSIPGQNGTIAFTITNSGVNAANGAWYDAIYISADSQWDIGDAFFGRVLHTGTVAAGGSYNSSLTAPLPGVLPGNYRVLVRSDIRNNLVESNEANNLSASLQSFALESPLLTLGTPTAGTLTTDGAVYYRVNVKVGETLVVDFDAQSNSGFTELYASFGKIPSRSQAEFSSIEPFRTDQRIVVPVTRAGTYYFFAYGTNVVGNGAFTITARTVNFTVFDTDYGNIGATNSAGTFELRAGEDLSGRNTLKINGAKFTGNTQATLVRGGREFPAVSYWMEDTSTLYATFDLPLFGATTGNEYGRYDLRVSDPHRGSVTVPSSVNIVPNARNSGRIEARFDGASSVQILGTYPVDLRIGNSSTADTYAPLVTLSSTRTNTPFGLSPSSMSVQTLQFLGIRNQGPAGIYSPGDTSTTGLYFRANTVNVGIDLSVITSQDATPIDWEPLRESLRPASISIDAWSAIFENLTGELDTWGDYVVMLNENATALSQLGERVSDLNELWSYEVQQAMGMPRPIATLSVTSDLSVPSPGLPLSLTRTFSSAITDRFSSGMFGRGWSTSWDQHLAKTNEGVIQILDGSQVRRQFIPLVSEPGRFTAATGDSGTLSFANGSWQIQESDGSVVAFRPDGRIDFIQDVNMNRISTQYTDGNLSRLTHSSGQFLAIASNVRGRPLSMTDSLGRSVFYGYDSTGEYLLSVTRDDGSTTSYAYNQTGIMQVRGSLASITEGGLTKHFTYDAKGRVSSSYIGSQLELNKYFYRYPGQVEVVDSRGSTSLFYGLAGLVSRSQNPLGDLTHMYYGDDNRISRIVDALGQTQSYQWCACGSLDSQTDALGNTVYYENQWIGPNQTIRRLTSFTDANGNRTKFGYDTRGNQTSITYADGSVETNGYDTAGNIITSTNARGQLLSNQYNTLGQIIRATYSDGSFTALEYDSRGNLSKITEPGGHWTEYVHDLAGRITRVTQADGRYLLLAYDSAGRRTSMTDQLGFLTTFGYDNAGRLNVVQSGSTQWVNYNYDPDGRVIRAARGNGTYSTYDYNAAGQLVQLKNFGPDNSITSSFAYLHDAIGRRIQHESLDGTWSYSYDPAGRAIGTQFLPSTNSPIAAVSASYVYDANGNVLQSTQNGVTTTNVFDSRNKRIRSGDAILSYDADGNLVSKTSSGATVSFGYDQLNRLIRIVDGANHSEFRWDFLGNRVSESINGQVTNLFNDPSGRNAVLVESDANQQVRARNIFGLGLTARVTPSGISYFEFDGSGNTAAISNSAGQILQRFAYSPFGMRLDSTVAPLVPQLLGGQYGWRPADQNDIFPVTLPQFPGPIGENPTLCVQYPLFTIELINTSPTSCNAIRCTQAVIAFAWNPITCEYFIYYFSYEEIPCPPCGMPFPRPEVPPPPVFPEPESPTTYSPSVSEPVSADPNDIIGPAGVGNERWISASLAQNYTIRFENDPVLANAPAQIVRVTQTLDGDLDPQSFRLGEFGFGGLIFDVPENRPFYATRLDLRELYGIYLDVFAGVDVLTSSIFWEFTSIDPATGEVPVDRFVGFLPPNITRPQGDGFVNYTVRAKSTAPTGAKIDALATIFFDQNAPIDTPPIFNTLDATPPSSSVLAMPETQSSSVFNVRWTASDGVVGSGTQSVDVYVSENGSDYRLWLDDTELLEASYVGTVGYAYAFMTVASDQTGNREAEPTGPDTQTYVFDPFGAPSVPDLTVSFDSGVSNSDHRTNQRRPQFVGSGVPGYTVILYANGLPIAQSLIDANGNYSVQPGSPLVDGSYVITADQLNPGGRRSPMSLAMSPALVIDGSNPTGEVLAVIPAIRASSIDQFAIRFNEAVSQFSVSSLQLKLNGGPNLLSLAQSLTSSDGGVNWVLTVNGLINSSGRYTLSLATNGIVDLAGNTLSSTATPGGALSTDVTLVLFTPSDIEIAPLDIYETGTTTSANVLFASLATVDQDVVDSFSYALVSGPGSADNDRFVVADNRLLLRTGQLLDYETQSLYNVRVQVSDSVGNTYTKSLRLDLLNVIETLLLSGNTATENLPAGRLVGGFSVADANPGASLSYALVPGAGSEDNGSFTLEANGNLRTSAVFNFESKSSYSIRVRTTDSTGQSLEQSFIISIVDLPEMLSPPVIGDGSNQRSLVDKLTLVFDGPVQLDAGAFTLVKRSTNETIAIQAVQSQNGSGQTQVVVTFSGSNTRGAGALIDGYYQLTIDGSKIRRGDLLLDINADGVGGDSRVIGANESDNFFALFGDTNGDGQVGVTEFGEFRSTFGKSSQDDGYNVQFDYEQNQAIGVADFGQFRVRFGKPKLPF